LIPAAASRARHVGRGGGREVTVSAHVGLDTTRCPTPFSAAFLPDTPPERLSVAFDLAGHELQPDEIAFCDFVG